MPNHYHLLIKAKKDSQFSKIMQRFSTSYTKAINKTYKRVGHLFQGRYKIKYIPNNEYLLHLSRYIHLNPVRAGLSSKPESWRHSNYVEFTRSSESHIKNNIISDQIKNYEEFVNNFNKSDIRKIKGYLF